MPEDELSSLTIPQLQARLAASGLKKAGKKSELIARLLGLEDVSVESSNFQGPFRCTSPGCSYSTPKTQLFGRHWNSKHLQDATNASFLDTATS